MYYSTGEDFSKNPAASETSTVFVFVLIFFTKGPAPTHSLEDATPYYAIIAPESQLGRR